MKIPGVWKSLSKFLYTIMISLKKNMMKKWTLCENIFEQLDERFFRRICYIKKDCYPEKILRQTARENFQLEFIFSPQRIIIYCKKKINSSWKFFRVAWQKIFSRYLLYKKWLISRKNLASNCSQKFSTRVHFFKIFAFC